MLVYMPLPRGADKIPAVEQNIYYCIQYFIFIIQCITESWEITALAKEKNKVPQLKYLNTADFRRLISCPFGDSAWHLERVAYNGDLWNKENKCHFSLSTHSSHFDPSVCICLATESLSTQYCVTFISSEACYIRKIVPKKATIMT